METRSKVFGGSEPQIKAIGAANQQSGHQKISNFSACKAQGHQQKIWIAFFEREKADMFYCTFSAAFLILKTRLQILEQTNVLNVKFCG